MLAFIVIGVAALVIVDWQARGADSVGVVGMPFATPGSSATTTGRIIFIHRDQDESSDLRAHELVHVCQWKEQGIKFLWNYSKEDLENLVEPRNFYETYEELSFEEEANLGEVDCELEHYLAPQP